VVGILNYGLCNVQAILNIYGRSNRRTSLGPPFHDDDFRQFSA
jgi:hypothetical protein